MTRKNNRISIKLNGTQLASPRERTAENKRSESAGQITEPAEAEMIPFPFAEERTEAKNLIPGVYERHRPSGAVETPAGAEEGGGSPFADTDAAQRLTQLHHTMEKAAGDGTAGYGTGRAPAAWAYRERGPYVDWTDGEAGGRRTMRRRPLFTGRNSNPEREWVKMLFASLSAVAIGICFGFLALSLFTDDKLRETYLDVLGGTMQTFSSAAVEVPTEQADLPYMEPGAATVAGNTSEKQGTAVPLEAPNLRMFLAQVGAFQDAASADTAIESLKERGYPHLLYEQDGQHYLFAAASPVRDLLLGVAAALQEQGMDVYIKELTVSRPIEPSAKEDGDGEQSAAGGSSPALQPLLAAGAELAERLALWSVQQLAQGGDSGPPTAELKAELQELHLRFLEQNRSLQPALDSTWKTLLEEMVGGLNQAMTAFSQAGSGPIQPYAWQAQQGVLTYLKTYAKLSKLPT